MDNKNKLLFTPGPLTTTETVKLAQLRDLGSREGEFIQIIKELRDDLLQLAKVPEQDFTSILLPGSGTYAIESVLTSVTPQQGKWLVIVNGQYGKRLVDILQCHAIAHTVLSFAEDSAIDNQQIKHKLEEESDISHIAIVHCETTTGMLNDIETVGKLAKLHEKTFFVDAMSSFAALPIDFQQSHIDFLVSSANKCLQSVPGFSFVIANKNKLKATEGWAKTFVLDLYQQWLILEKHGQFRFTPPVQAILACQQAMFELQQEGGVSARAERYTQNQQTLVQGMRELGFKEFLPESLQSCIITTFCYPEKMKFDFDDFYQQLLGQGFVIYPGKLTKAQTFRIGSIGDLTVDDIHNLLATIGKY